MLFVMQVDDFDRNIVIRCGSQKILDGFQDVVIDKLGFASVDGNGTVLLDMQNELAQQRFIEKRDIFVEWHDVVRAFLGQGDGCVIIAFNNMEQTDDHADGYALQQIGGQYRDNGDGER